MVLQRLVREGSLSPLSLSTVVRLKERTRESCFQSPSTPSVSPSLVQIRFIVATAAVRPLAPLHDGRARVYTYFMLGGTSELREENILFPLS